MSAITTTEIVPESFEENAAEAWLGSGYQDILEHFDKQWNQQNSERWKDRYEYVTNSKKTLNDAEGKDLDVLGDDKLWELAELTSEFVSDDAALPMYLSYQQRHAESIGAAYHIGRILISRKDDQALPHLKVAFNGPGTLEYAAQWGYDFLTEQGREQEAEIWWEEALKVNTVHQAAYLERASVTPEDGFEQAIISKPLLEDIKQQLSSHKNVGSVWIAQKVLNHSPEGSVYVVTFRPRGFYLSYGRVMKNVGESLNCNADVFVVCLWGDTRKLGKKIKKAGVKIL